MKKTDSQKRFLPKRQEALLAIPNGAQADIPAPGSRNAKVSNVIHEKTMLTKLEFCHTMEMCFIIGCGDECKKI